MSDFPPAGTGYGADPAGGPELGGYAGEVPPEAAGRLGGGAFSSGLSVNDFAACLQMGLRPVALVQGFCVMQWSWYGAGSPYLYGGGGWGGGGMLGGGGMFGGGGMLGGPGRVPGTMGGGFGGPFGAGGGFGAGGYRGGGYRGGGYRGGQAGFRQSRWGTTLSTYRCPHYYVDMEHRSWGENFEQRWKTDVWAAGFNTAYHRMIAEAHDAGADGVIGVVDTVTSLIDSSIREFHIYGTAVVAEEGSALGGDAGPVGAGGSAAGGDRPIWTSYLAGQRLAKLVEAGYVPISVVASMASVRIWAVCLTEMMMHGSMQMGGYAAAGEITQVADAQMQVRDVVRDHVKSTLGNDTLQGADLDVVWNDVAEGDFEVEAVLRGTRVHQVRPADPLPPPELIVRMR